MKIAPKPDADELLAGILAAAVAISRDSRERVLGELADILLAPPTDRWADRAERATDARLAVAARTLPRLADDAMRPFVRRAVVRLVDAIRGLAEWQPKYGPRVVLVTAPSLTGVAPDGRPNDPWPVATVRPTAESVVALDELRSTVKLRLAELWELHRPHRDAMERMLAVLRLATPVTPTAADLAVSEWFAKIAESAAA